MSLSVPIPSLAQFRPGKPLLKWAGGKSQLLPELRRIIPARFTRYVEPFLGGGALFWNLALPGSWVNDSNPELVHFCSIVRDEPEVLQRQYRKCLSTETISIIYVHWVPKKWTRSSAPRGSYT